GSVYFGGGDGDVVEALYGMGRIEFIGCPWCTGIGFARHRKFELQPIGVEEGEVVLAEFFRGVIVEDIVRVQSVFPKIKAACRYGIAYFGNLTGTTATLFHTVAQGKNVRMVPGVPTSSPK